MGRRPGLNEAVVVDAAAELINETGPEALSIAALAQRLQVKSPSLYNHINGLDGLQQKLALRGLEQLTAVLQTSVMGRAGFEALTALAEAYRQFAKEQPGLYAFTVRSTEQDTPEMQDAGRAAIEVVLAVFRGYGLEGDVALHATRCLRSALHGFVSLEAGSGFGLPLDLDVSFEHLLQTMDCGYKTGFGE